MPVPADWAQELRAFVEEWWRLVDQGEFVGDEYLGEAPFPKFVLTETAASWDQFIGWQSSTDGRCDTIVGLFAEIDRIEKRLLQIRQEAETKFREAKNRENLTFRASTPPE
jgi:hypothetical protein